MNEPEVAAGVSTEAQLQGFLNMFEPEVGDVAVGYLTPTGSCKAAGSRYERFG